MSLFDRWTNRKLREDFDSLARKFNGLEADHKDLYDRFLRLQGRLAKRGELSTPPGDPQSTEGVPGTMTGRAAAVQAAILARRGVHSVPR